MKKHTFLLAMLLSCLTMAAQKTYSNDVFRVEYDNSEWTFEETVLGDKSSGQYVVFFTNTTTKKDLIGITELKTDLSLNDFANNQLKNNSLFSGKRLIPLHETKVGDKTTMQCLYEYSNEYGSGNMMAWFFKGPSRTYLVVNLYSGNSYAAGMKMVESLKERTEEMDSADEARIVNMYKTYDAACKRGEGYKDEKTQDIYTTIDQENKLFVYGHQIITRDKEYIGKMMLIIEKGHDLMIPEQEDFIRLLELGYKMIDKYYDADNNFLGEMVFTKDDLRKN